MTGRSEDYKRLVTSTRWRKVRNVWISRHPLCADCLASGRTTPATQVHHIVPVDSGRTPADKERLAYDQANLRSLCGECHRRVHIELGKGRPEDRKARTRNEAETFWTSVRSRASRPPGGVFQTGEGVSEISPRPFENARHENPK